MQAQDPRHISLTRLSPLTCTDVPPPAVNYPGPSHSSGLLPDPGEDSDDTVRRPIPERSTSPAVPNAPSTRPTKPALTSELPSRAERTGEEGPGVADDSSRELHIRRFQEGVDQFGIPAESTGECNPPAHVSARLPYPERGVRTRFGKRGFGKRGCKRERHQRFHGIGYSNRIIEVKAQRTGSG
ncbi:hypothetical protein BDK51DRAFT_48535 [Blyttiomyces helicus]|uniref:Uncharacterized protein n=1 Tax=Blyttiomyces helicus TaxID=388810 RepID=A0A4P9W0P4_9FUNG|nr:hypothetical protein BDK51DRAFT_48535 [Blyttiomyces helicus]|eukprot:RKO85721.1 hypothetical protein BDK51DRAFT_48535 [Blyttiomyces helicus]